MSGEWLNEAANLEPTTYVHYLRTRGWNQIAIEDDFPFTRFEREAEGGLAQIDVPARSALGDYRRRIGEVVAVLLAVERLAWPELFVRLCSPSVDEFRLRLVGGDHAGGRIGIDDAIRLRVARKQLLLAAAHSVEEPRARFLRLGFTKPREFLARCNELPVVPGSWVSSVQIPVTPAIGSDGDASIPYARKVTEMLARGLTAVAAALGRGGEGQLLNSAAHGVSSNFLSALAELRPVAEIGSLELDLIWSRSRPPPIDPWQTIRVGAESFAVFESSATWLRVNTPVDDVSIEGHVISLARDNPSEGLSQGEIVILSEIEEHERPKRIHVQVVVAEDHALALRAYHSGSRVRLRGTLVREGRTWRLKRPGPLQEQTPSSDEDLED